jgi:hypothetical protein
MTDIVDRLRKWCHAPNAASAQDIMDEAADEVQRLRNGAANVRETVQPEPVAWAILHKDHQYVSLLRENAEAHNVYTDSEIVPLYSHRSPTLTDAEREAIETAIATLDAFRYPTLPAAADTLRNLLERLK